MKHLKCPYCECEYPTATNELPNEKDFIIELNAIITRVHKCAIDHGWWETDRNPYELIALMHAELSECVEYLRQGNPTSDHIQDFTGEEEELADCIIRILDLGGRKKLRLADAIIAKINYNEHRPYRHGNKKA